MGSVTVIGNPTSELVIEKILNMITKGELKIGDRLPSAQKLAEICRFGRFRRFRENQVPVGLEPPESIARTQEPLRPI